MNTDDASGFARLIQHGLDVGAMEELITVRYVHRLAMTGEPLYYTGMIVRKHADLRLGHLGARNDN
ncbi:MAG: hypothetical protein GWO16_04525, partial [Gammaproteobacteria bacterium]|nr:hypothetical protein [Gammaproteobacteria bacterium]NIR97361.1 hypothetical protein [Gammaproteobacteria bacterium]NIT63021.1 hypothetical protein [Gammaproteobacteria bacterium]NIV19975.1 hypothetical protein [Gammaproteobacteria bacterium]NIY31601.1 hypothetical protein [Gammaproteobacteria bacterium]